VRQASVILLFSLLLLPTIWNGVTLIHYAIEHTHTFCNSDSEHLHSSPAHCLSIFQLAESQNQSQLPSTTKIEFQELKQYLTPNLEFKQRLFLSFPQNHFISPPLLDKGFSKDIFHPPIFA